jgi:hypothetical protein
MTRDEPLMDAQIAMMVTVRGEARLDTPPHTGYEARGAGW